MEVQALLLSPRMDPETHKRKLVWTLCMRDKTAGEGWNVNSLVFPTTLICTTQLVLFLPNS